MEKPPTATPAAQTLSTTSTYIDLTKLTSDTFSPYQYANEIVRSVNTTSSAAPSNPSDPLVDLTTPLQKTLFDLQEIDTSIHTLTSKSALDILTYTQHQNATAKRILSQVDEERAQLVANFERLKTEVLGRYERAQKTRVAAERSLLVLRLTRAVQRVLSLGRAFESVVADSRLGDAPSGKEDHRALVQAASTALTFRDLITTPEMQDMGLGRVAIVRQVRGRVFEDGEERLKDWARKVVREFNMNSYMSSGTSTATMSVVVGSNAESAKARFESAIHILYLLSPTSRLERGRKMKQSEFEAEDLLRSLQGFVQSAVSSSAAGIGRGLGQLPALERALSETSGRCLSIRALEMVLGDVRPPMHPLLELEKKAKGRKHAKARLDQDEDGDSDIEEEEIDSLVVSEEENLGVEESVLDMLLSSLDTSSLTSYFWRSLASSLSPKVQEIINRGGVSARTLKSNKESVRAQIRDCVLKGSKMPGGLIGQGGKDEVVGSWEREAAVMVGSVVGPMGR